MQDLNPKQLCSPTAEKTKPPNLFPTPPNKRPSTFLRKRKTNERKKTQNKPTPPQTTQQWNFSESKHQKAAFVHHSSLYSDPQETFVQESPTNS